ncbi:lipoxygenase family protein [Sorangium sp. So ce887]|uniref:lipoxygenase family protein n=1 Tax=Sorangium sp. So ce887 TaxID=3133324 RepID=UPI003F5E4422
MDPFTLLVLPQNDTPENRVKRSATLKEQQQHYRFDYNTKTLAGLPMAATPIPIELSLVWASGLGEMVLTLGENLLNIVAPNVIEFDVQIQMKVGKPEYERPKASAPPPSLPSRVEVDIEGAPKDVPLVLHELTSDAERFRQDLKKARAELARFTIPNPAAFPPVLPAPSARPSARPSLLGDVAAFVEKDIAAPIEITVEQRVLSWLDDLVKIIAEFLGKLMGIYGRATDIFDYQEQFRSLPLPWPVGVYQTDEIFAQMRVAGPNPIMIRRVNAEDLKGFSLGTRAADIEDAQNRNALYIADYSALSILKPGTNPAPKYPYVPKALFEVPASGSRSLRPLAIQISPGGPVFFPDGGTPWEVAKIIVNMADVNYHELVSHLGLTHLLTEPFVITTYRQLDPMHPLFALLTPHFSGTLFINYAAQTTLVADGGAVDQLLVGTIESSRLLAANVVESARYNRMFFPDTLVERGVDDVKALPDYPYRDDALALWNAVHAWVTAYVSVYYPTSADVLQDYQLQAWIAELASEDGGRIKDIGDKVVNGTPQIETAEYLARLLTQVIFTASVQHAAVNFPQRTMMAYTPAMPFATYAEFPSKEGAPATQPLDVLPPLQMGLLQQLVATALGGVYYTTLGQYGGELALRQVGEALQAFQRELRRIEVDINGKNALRVRTSYTTLLPSAIPQSINI